MTPTGFYNAVNLCEVLSVHILPSINSI